MSTRNEYFQATLHRFTSLSFGAVVPVIYGSASRCLGPLEAD